MTVIENTNLHTNLQISLSRNRHILRIFDYQLENLEKTIKSLRQESNIVSEALDNIIDLMLQVQEEKLNG